MFKYVLIQLCPYDDPEDADNEDPTMTEFCDTDSYAFTFETPEAAMEYLLENAIKPEYWYIAEIKFEARAPKPKLTLIEV